ncbi:MAG TPA: L,D-transpeptidase family protein [Chitinophagaceae bacterium]|nr:L,D-transpeptidase family protein [Chitinophagaceae bacterium]
MRITRSLYPICQIAFFATLLLESCKSKGAASEQDAIVATPGQMNEKVSGFIKELLGKSVLVDNLSGDTIELRQPELTSLIYQNNSYAPAWSDQQLWKPVADSLYEFISASKLFGLFPEDYHFKDIEAIRAKMVADSAGQAERKNAALWTEADVMLTDAFVQIIKDLKLGRLPNDSITLRKDSVLEDEFYLNQFNELNKTGSVIKISESLEPRQKGYKELKRGIKKFLENADYKEYTFVPSSKDDPIKYRKLLQKRLYESRYISFDSVAADSAQLAVAVKKFQKDNGLTVDGVAGEGTLRVLNTSDREKFIRIAISLDKYKLLPEEMPSKYIWVNASGNFMEVVENEETKLVSKVICGKPKTRTPVLTSAISTLITYPQWVPPSSIIRKEILPAVKKNPGYLAKKGFSLLDSKGEEVDPYSVDWSKYSKGIPYRVVQGSGDANALGIMKFYFDNKYSVYLHDTNQRYLFGNPMRSLSHGCVRVQEWEPLAWYILRNDDLGTEEKTEARIDSVKTWLQKKQKRNIAIRKKLPVFIRYITCEGKDGNIVFFDDPYNEDKVLRETHFASK